MVKGGDLYGPRLLHVRNVPIGFSCRPSEALPARFRGVSNLNLKQAVMEYRHA